MDLGLHERVSEGLREPLPRVGQRRSRYRIAALPHAASALEVGLENRVRAGDQTLHGHRRSLRRSLSSSSSRARSRAGSAGAPADRAGAGSWYELMSAVGAQHLQSFSPQAPQELVGEFAISSAAEIYRAVALARSAQPGWWTGGAAGRAAAMMACAAELRARRAEVAALVVSEVGKPVVEANGEVTRAISILEYYAQA